MKRLTSWNSLLRKYVMTATWILCPIITSIVVYRKFGDPLGFYLLLAFLPIGIMTYPLMKITYDENQVIVSDWFHKHIFRFDDLKSIEFPNRPFISFHLYSEMVLTTKRDEVKKFKFSPRTSLFEPLSITKNEYTVELLDLWKAHKR
ncbi:hypothetical protein WSM22_06750 [Cytophagales bacterium WSM2-2]|nr:hypothetical protein WSM22_06750 [Cytophagales bacterium WSM2-2]